MKEIETSGYLENHNMRRAQSTHVRRKQGGSLSAADFAGGEGALASSPGDAERPDAFAAVQPKEEGPRWSAEDDNRRLEQLNKSLHAVRHISSKIVAALEGVDERILSVEHEIGAMYKVTSRLRTVNTNTSAALAAVDSALAYFYLESEIAQAIQQGPGRDLPAFLELMARLDATVAFFEANSNYKSAEGALKQLRGLKGKAVESCEHLYAHILEKCSAPMEPATFPAPMPKELELLEERQKERLLLLSDVLAKSPVLARDYAEHRTRFFLGTIRKLPAAARRGGAAQKKGEVTPQVSRLPEAAAVAASVSAVTSSASNLSQLEGEEDLSKAFAEFSLVFLRVAEHERRLAWEMFGDGQLFAQTFSAVLEGPLDIFVRLAEATVRTRPRSLPEVERLFYLLDIYDELSGKLKGLHKVTRVGEGYRLSERVPSIVDMFRAAVKQALTFFLETVQRDNVKVGPDGNVHPCSSRTLNYVGKRILPKRTCIEFLVDKWLDVSQVTMPVIVLTVCNELCFNLEDKAKRLEKKQPILANIFLLNNYHYILHTVSSNNMLERDLMLTFSAQLDKKILQEIAKYRLSWDQAIEFLQEGAAPARPGHSSDYKQIKNRFAGFNKALEKLFHTQKLYTIPNNNLRSEMREIAKSIVVPLYKGFLARYAEVPFTKNRSKYEQYTVETLVQMLDALFTDL